jgi:hypothetical protein
MQCVPTILDPTTASAKKATLVTEEVAQILMNAVLTVTIAMLMHTVITKLDLTSVNVSPAILETANSAVI